MTRRDWGDGGLRTIGLFLNGEEIPARTPPGRAGHRRVVRAPLQLRTTSRRRSCCRRAGSASGWKLELSTAEPDAGRARSTSRPGRRSRSRRGRSSCCAAAGSVEGRQSRWPGRAQHRELVGDLEVGRAEAEDLRRPSARAAGGRRSPVGDEHAAPQEDALEVGRGDLVAERRRVEVAELRDGEGLGREREAEVRVGELRAQALAAGERERAVVEGGRRQARRPGASRVLRARPGRCPVRTSPR